MTSLLKTFVCFALFGTVSTGALAASHDPEPNVDDHLVPLEGWFEPAYKGLLARKLFVTRANYARIVEFPPLPSEGESSVAIYSKTNDPEGTLITRTKGERNLWSAEFGTDPSFPKGVKVTRCDAWFPKSTAVAVQEAVKRMLDQSRPLENPRNAIIVDAPITEFSVEDPKRGREGAFLTPYAAGKTGAALRKIAQLLAEYCDTKPVHRAALAKRIEAEAERLR